MAENATSTHIWEHSGESSRHPTAEGFPPSCTSNRRRENVAETTSR